MSLFALAIEGVEYKENGKLLYHISVGYGCDEDGFSRIV